MVEFKPYFSGVMTFVNHCAHLMYHVYYMMWCTSLTDGLRKKWARVAGGREGWKGLKSLGRLLVDH